MTLSLIFAVVLVSQSAHCFQGKLVLVVLDGLAPNYLSNEEIQTPNLDKLSNKGIVVKDVQPEFPASKLPFLTSLLTGRHSLENEVIGTQWFDSVANKVISVDADSDDLFWNKTKEFGTLWVRGFFNSTFETH